MNEQLGNKLAGLTQQAVDSAVWQVKFWIPLELVGEALIVLAAISLLVFTVKRWKLIKDQDMEPFFIIGGVVLGLIALCTLLFGVPNTISGVYNPTYWAVKALLHD